MQLKLRQTWTLGARIGGGGFGQVHVAKSADHESAVVKLVPKAPGAERELLFADLTGVRNIVPIIDHGETEDSWALVMPRADKSLRQYLAEAAGPLSTAEAVRALSDIAVALADLDGRVVHRDLKPENVLLLDGHWCLADFGISRYAEATTAPDTRKYALSPPYAAPERWRNERATIATDVYSLGVIAYELLSGSLPFIGPDLHDFRGQHLHSDPVYLTGVTAALGALVEECLYKAPDARPSPSNIVARLARAAEAAAPSAGLARLEEANRANVIRRGERGRQESAHQSEDERRKALSDAASRGLARVAGAFNEAIMHAAPSASLSAGLDVGWTALLNQSELRFAPSAATPSNPWGSSSPPAFEVIAFSTLSLQIPNRDGYEGRSHSLWYCDAQEAGQYHWFETAFMMSPLIPHSSRQAPFALNPGENSAKAVGTGMAEIQVAWPFTVISISDLDDFIGRWAGWFADAAQGQLNRPSTMPERDPRGSWRQR